MPDDEPVFRNKISKKFPETPPQEVQIHPTDRA